MQDIAARPSQHPILVRDCLKLMNQCDAPTEKSPVLQIKRFFSEPWFGFCNLALTALYLRGIQLYPWRYQSWVRPTSACDPRLAWVCNVPKEVNDFNDYQ
ncbi:hypothetical protein [Pseudomonas syringae]|uniref:hypothetical protein n=1 Tax=Pseudomonas syringae TaxID=317 RepID=UPI0012AECDAD|nr:hypothetical protein [Pseudomonas syringae]